MSLVTNLAKPLDLEGLVIIRVVRASLRATAFFAWLWNQLPSS